MKYTYHRNTSESIDTTLDVKSLIQWCIHILLCPNMLDRHLLLITRLIHLSDEILQSIHLKQITNRVSRIENHWGCINWIQIAKMRQCYLFVWSWNGLGFRCCNSLISQVLQIIPKESRKATFISDNIPIKIAFFESNYNYNFLIKKFLSLGPVFFVKYEIFDSPSIAAD